MLSGAVSYHAIFQNLSGAQSSGHSVIMMQVLSHLRTEIKTVKFPAMLFLTVLNASRSSVLGCKGVVRLQNKH